MAFRFFILSFFYVAFCYSQQQQDDTSIKKLDKVDLIETQSTNLNQKRSNISTSNALEDHSEVSKLDEKWQELLYNNNLFDTIYNSVTELDYKEVDYPELPTDTLIKRLNELDAKTPFNISYNPSLESVIKSYLKNRRNSIQKLITLSSLYFPLFEQELDNQNIPLEIKYLAIVESALNPRAKSRVGATGLWQFMYHTGKMYGLDVNSYVDERSDPVKATKAAVSFLSDLYKTFGDWDLALAAYNSGPGNVTKAIRRSGGNKNYWEIRRNLPKETAGYVPAFLANLYIFEYAEQHGFKKYKAEHAYFETDTIRVKNTVGLKHVSELIGTPIEKLKYLNPSYKLDVIPYVKEENYVLRLPHDAVGKFVSNEDSIYSYARADFEKFVKPKVVSDTLNKMYYTVKTDDLIENICKTHGVEVNDLKKWNNLNADVLQEGQQLVIFTKTPPTSTSDAKGSADKLFYTVKSGDFIGKICKTYGVEMNDLKRWNDLNSNMIHIGQRLVIYSKNHSTSTAIAKAPLVKAPITKENGDKLFYTVKSGDFINKICKAYSVDVNEFKKWNNLNKDVLHVGQKLVIYQKTQSTTTPEIKENLDKLFYTVKSGDVIGDIASVYGAEVSDIKKWNDLTEDHLNPGQQLTIYTNNKQIASAPEKEKTVNLSSKLNAASVYTVKSGDTLWSISKKFAGVSVQKIKEWNGITDASIKEGMQLKILN